MFRFTFESHEECQEWYFELSRHVPRVIEAHKEVSAAKIEDCQTVFHSPNCKRLLLSALYIAATF